MEILLIEDDIKLKRYISEYLEAYDYSVTTIEDFNTVMETVNEVSPNLIVLDINLPKFDGFYFLKLIRKSYNTPIIILSARSDEGEQIRGMELGADDYVTKPFSVGILLAKINALLRRVCEYSEVENECQGELFLIHESMKLKYKDQIIELTKNEYRILNILIKNTGKVVTREDMLEALWDDTVFVDDNTLTVNMTRVKKRLSDLGINNVIVTKRGVGYVFNGIDS
ncbi:DNA-binding response regulator, OmpR family, contains REC and winged-helix (wHTH) domain [Clostridium cavendishii DSM 21758]|uniref:Stage 0 sporulation protein A homolog n=1 Tax=Clostridium cavendishii DSM 21758 TaxID=1121302 RepID=A0A1M6FF12_9CLOT|nr:response regulator transcription factor [Clostridium cavendishii]SHI96237.1 DNA-binding response regulator, OmpR family, contains REC and winged-helix (wHTH) domain [Clostridium cavendishii DSM 21758]